MAEAMAAGVPIQRILVAEGHGPALEELVRQAKDRGIPVSAAPRRELDRLSKGVVHQGVVAESAPYPYRSLEDLIATVEEAEQAGRAGDYPPPIVVADGLLDPQNLGALVRALDGAGAAGLVIGRRRAAAVTPAVHKASAGAVEHVPVVQVTNLVRTLETLKGRGYWVVGLSERAETSLWQVALNGRIVLAVGSEGKGLGRLLRERCDFLVRIPLKGRLASLNAAQAAAVVLFERLRRSET